ncbi:239_t:CDS:1, partial [Racocetra persica]
NFNTICSNGMVFFVMPEVSFIAGIVIMLKQDRKNRNFRRWFGEHRKFVSAVTVLSAIDIQELQLIHSDFCRCILFECGFDDHTKRALIYFECC